MAASPFAFFRGTFHLFARDILERFYEASPRVAGAESELDLVGDDGGRAGAERGLSYQPGSTSGLRRGAINLQKR